MLIEIRKNAQKLKLELSKTIESKIQNFLCIFQTETRTIFSIIIII